MISTLGELDVALALAALLFLYRAVLNRSLPWMENVVRARRPKRLPVVLSPQEVRRTLAPAAWPILALASLLYGSGLRLLEALRLRVKDFELERLQLIARNGKGAKDRLTVVPRQLLLLLRTRRSWVRDQHRIATEAGFGGVELPAALDKKFPRAHLDFGWQYVFPAARAGYRPARRPQPAGPGWLKSPQLSCRPAPAAD